MVEASARRVTSANPARANAQGAGPEPQRPVEASENRPGQLQNALSVDVEDYFQVAALKPAIRRQDWDTFESRVELNTRRLMELFARFKVKATMFTLGWVAERFPGLVREMRDSGHELALHGYDHRSLTEMTAEEFRADLRKAKTILEDISGAQVIGYRAPNYSVVRKTLWALDILGEEGFRYDSSIFPIRHDRYGIPDSPRFPWRIPNGNGPLMMEFPISTIRIAGINFPFVGGGYLRHFPGAVCRWGIKHLNTVEHQPAIVYVHPWEIDPGQPRVPVRWLTRFRHYHNLDRTESRLEALLSEFRFTTVRAALGL